MNIKNLIKSQQVRHSILKCFTWIPDRIMLPLQYWLILKRWPNLNNPKRFTEFIQLYKMAYRNKDMLRCVDKYAVRDYVSERMGDDRILNELYQVCDDASDINFNSLPNKFVIKTTDGGNGDNVLIVRDKSQIDVEAVIRKVDSWRGKKYYAVSREWAYKGAKKSRVIVEKLLESSDSNDGSIDDYKLLCFNGKFKYLWVDKDRFSNHRRGFWNENLEFLPNVVSDHPTFEKAPELPTTIPEMICIAEKLAAGFPFVRVDFYDIDGKVVFGEMTYYPWSGYVQYTPDEFDFRLGKEFSFWR